MRALRTSMAMHRATRWTALTVALLATASQAQAQTESQPQAPQERPAQAAEGKNTPFSGDQRAGQAEYTVIMERVDVAEPYRLGTVMLRATDEGLRIMPDLKGLSPGEHGFHVHSVAKCSPHAGEGDPRDPAHDAAGHYDPRETNRHAGPDGNGHLGDLPVLEVDEQGRAATAMVAPRLRLNDVAGRSLIIHEGGDNYSDEPDKAGGGGQRIACGIIRQ